MFQKHTNIVKTHTVSFHLLYFIYLTNRKKIDAILNSFIQSAIKVSRKVTHKQTDQWTTMFILTHPHGTLQAHNKRNDASACF